MEYNHRTEPVPGWRSLTPDPERRSLTREVAAARVLQVQEVAAARVLQVQEVAAARVLQVREVVDARVLLLQKIACEASSAATLHRLT